MPLQAWDNLKGRYYDIDGFAGVLATNLAGTNYLALTGSTATQTISAANCVVGLIVISQSGASALNIVDGSGVTVAILPASAAPGPYPFFVPAKGGAFLAPASGGPRATIFYTPSNY